MSKQKQEFVVSKEISIGFELPTESRQLTLEMNAIPGGGKTIHNDYDAAKREGLEFPVAVGTTVAALIFKIMRRSFGEGWFIGGKSDLTLRRAVHAEDRVTARGTVKEKIHEGDRVRVVCDLWVETSEGEKAIVGTCSGMVPNSD